MAIIQMCLRACNEDEFIVKEGGEFLLTLSELFIDESGAWCSRGWLSWRECVLAVRYFSSL